MFPLPISVYINIALVLCTSFITHKLDVSNHQKQIIQQQQQAIEHETKVVNDQAIITQQTQKDKDDLQNKYNTAIAQLRGLRQQLTTSNNQPSAPIIPSEGLRLLEPDGEFLVNFAKQCQATEIERNEVIEKYNALMVNK